MITVANAALFAEKAKENSVATVVIDYDDNYYIVEVVDKRSKDKGVDENCPYVAVDKKTGKVTGFTPMEDLDKFFDAVENRSTVLT